jgi:hypothetical protein
MEAKFSWRMLRAQIRANALALISLTVALFSVSHSTWRNERTEQNRNVRAAAFQLLDKLAEFERVVFLAHYDHDAAMGNPRIGWTDVIVIHDLASVAPAPLESKATKLREVWRANWEQLNSEDDASIDRRSAPGYTRHTSRTEVVNLRTSERLRRTARAGVRTVRLQHPRPFRS